MLALQRSSYGAFLTARGQLAEAEPLLTQSHEVLRATFGDAHRYTEQAAQRLVDLYEAWGRAEQAESLRRRAGSTLEER